MGLQGMRRNLGNFLSQRDARVLAVCDVMKAASRPTTSRRAIAYPPPCTSVISPVPPGKR